MHDGTDGEMPRSLRVGSIVLPALLVAIYVAVDYFFIEVVFPPAVGQVVLLLVGLAGVVTYSVIIFSRLDELRRQETEQRRAIESLANELATKSEMLRALNATGLTLSAELSTDTVLQKIADLAREVVSARYAALGVFDDDGRCVQFISSGITAEQRSRIGSPPEGRGILGLLQRDQRPIRLRDLKEHPASVPFPPHHPQMHSFLGAPIIWRRRSVGNLYLAEKIGAPEFSQADEDALITFAAQAAIAIENARLYAQEGHMATLEERQRIGMDLHDGVMQTLYGVGLLVEGAAIDITGEPDRARDDLGRAVDRLNAAIADLRSYVMELRPVRGSDLPLAEAIPQVAHQIATNALLKVNLDISAECDALLDREQREAAFYVASDAMGNVARHARASRLDVRLVPSGDAVLLEVTDDGVGFPAERAVEGFGLRNMKERAFTVGGRLRVDTKPGAGTRIRLELPLRERTM